MKKDKRWHTAQEYEQTYWKNRAEQIVSGQTTQLDWYEWRANEMEKRLATHFMPEKRKAANILEVGSGPIGIISFIKWGQRNAVDPLEGFYGTNDVLSHLRDPEVKYIEGTGEKLPFSDESFSLTILDNVLDHVRNADIVLNEVNRILAKDGLLYIAVNIHTQWGGFLHKILSAFNIDRGHPYTFTILTIKKTILQHGYDVLSEWISDYKKARDNDRMSDSRKTKIKGYIGLSEFVYYAVCSKRLDTVNSKM